MNSKDKSVTPPEIAHADLKGLTEKQLQQRIDAYCANEGAGSQQELAQNLLHELQVHQVELEVQNHELQEAQRQLEEARDRYADLYDFAPVCYFTLDDLGCIHEINLTGAAMLGQERGLLLGKPFNLWLTKESGQAFFSHLKKALQSRQVETCELRLRSTKGARREVRLETVVNPEPIDHKPAYRCVVIDISAYKQAEQEVQHRGRQLRLLSDAMPTFIGYIDRQERYQFANKVYEEWFQLPRERIRGKTVRELIGEKSYSEVAEYIQTALAGKTVHFEVTYPVEEGQERQFSVSFIPDFAEDGSVPGYFALGRDVTEQRRHEALEKIHMLEAARVMRINTMGEMVAELAHELNQPLAAITIYSDAVSRMLRKQTVDVLEMQKALREIRSQAERAGDVILRLREFVSKREFQSETIQINGLVKEVVHLIAVEARWHGVEVKLELGEAIPPVTVDRILIEQVILNLTRNAIEAMDAIEQAKRRLTLKTSHGTHNEVVLSVEDSGPGLSIAEIEKIFEPFYTTKEHGMGMGLAISRSITKAHRGHLWAIPNESGGTTFTMTLPVEAQIE